MPKESEAARNLQAARKLKLAQEIHDLEAHNARRTDKRGSTGSRNEIIETAMQVTVDDEERVLSQEHGQAEAGEVLPDSPLMSGFSISVPSIPGGATFRAMSVLDTGLKLRMNPMQMSKAGVVIQNMQGADYTDVQINHVCRALYLDQCEEDMRQAWLVFVEEDQSMLDTAKFRKVRNA